MDGDFRGGAVLIKVNHGLGGRSGIYVQVLSDFWKVCFRLPIYARSIWNLDRLCSLEMAFADEMTSFPGTERSHVEPSMEVKKRRKKPYYLRYKAEQYGLKEDFKPGGEYLSRRSLSASDSKVDLKSKIVCHVKCLLEFFPLLPSPRRRLRL